MNFEEAPKQAEAMEVSQMPPLKASADVIRPMNDVCELNCNLAEGVHCAEPAMQRDVTDVPVEEVRPCCGYCCCIYSLFCGCPSCIGITGACTLLICQCKYTYCKLLDCKDEDSRCCAMCQLNWFLTAPNKLYECTGQYFCMDMRAAFPCTKKVPCVMAGFGFTCCADFKCVGCKFLTRLGDTIPRLDERAGKSGD